MSEVWGIECTKVMPQRWVSFLALFLYSLGIWLKLLSSMQQFSSISSGSAAISLISVSKSSMKSNPAALTLSSCCLFFVSGRRLFYHPVYSDSARLCLRRGRRFNLGRVWGYSPGSSVATASSGFDDVVDLVSLPVSLVLSVWSWFFRLCGISSSKFLN